VWGVEMLDLFNAPTLSHSTLGALIRNYGLVRIIHPGFSLEMDFDQTFL
jgi:hypothetical protein